jgi:hypothetical protein
LQEWPYFVRFFEIRQSLHENPTKLGAMLLWHTQRTAGRFGNMTKSRNRINFGVVLRPELFTAIDEHRGPIPRSVWIGLACEEQLAREGSNYNRRPSQLKNGGKRKKEGADGPRMGTSLVRPTQTSRKPRPTTHVLNADNTTLPAAAAQQEQQKEVLSAS